MGNIFRFSSDSSRLRRFIWLLLMILGRFSFQGQSRVEQAFTDADGRLRAVHPSTWTTDGKCNSDRPPHEHGRQYFFIDGRMRTVEAWCGGIVWRVKLNTFKGFAYSGYHIYLCFIRFFTYPSSTKPMFIDDGRPAQVYFFINILNNSVIVEVTSIISVSTSDSLSKWSSFRRASSYFDNIMLFFKFFDE